MVHVHIKPSKATPTKCVQHGHTLLLLYKEKAKNNIINWPVQPRCRRQVRPSYPGPFYTKTIHTKCVQHVHTLLVLHKEKASKQNMNNCRRYRSSLSPPPGRIAWGQTDLPADAARYARVGSHVTMHGRFYSCRSNYIKLNYSQCSTTYVTYYTFIRTQY